MIIFINMKFIIKESQLKKLLTNKQISESLLSTLLRGAAQSTKNITKSIKNFGKNLTKKPINKPIVKPVRDTIEHINLQKNNLIRRGIKVLKQNELPKKFYHGSSKKITFSDLTTTAAEKTRVKHSTGSSGMDGMYFAENLWDNMSHHNQFKNPVYKQGEKSVGVESAEKYAQMAIKDRQKGYIYEMELTPEAIIVPDGSITGINTARIDSEDMKKLLSMGVDGIYRSKNEIVILNKRAIKSFNLKYTGDKFVGNTTKNTFGDKTPAQGSYGFNWKPI